jgi:hypothetical protein
MGKNSTRFLIALGHDSDQMALLEGWILKQQDIQAFRLPGTLVISPAFIFK